MAAAATALGNPAGEIYGKVVESVGNGPIGVKIRFASVTPELNVAKDAQRLSSGLKSSSPHCDWGMAASAEVETSSDGCGLRCRSVGSRARRMR